MSPADPIRLVAFDVDGTLLRGRTVCECIADGIGRGAEMAAFERLNAQDAIQQAREEMALWYREHPTEALLRLLDQAQAAPGIPNAFERLRSAGVRIALVSITWRFAVEALAKRWGAEFAIGTGLTTDWTVEHFWPSDKPAWLRRLATTLDIPMSAVAAVGDSGGDVPMLLAAGRGYFVGDPAGTLPPHVLHWPNADIDEIARDLLKA